MCNPCIYKLKHARKKRAQDISRTIGAYPRQDSEWLSQIKDFVKKYICTLIKHDKT